MALTPGQVQALSAQEFEWARGASEVYFGEDVIAVASAAAPAASLFPLLRKDTTFLVALGVNMTIPTLPGARPGMRVTFVFAAAGVFTVTWPANFSATANGAAANNQFGSTTFVFNGTKWVQDSGALAFKA